MIKHGGLNHTDSFIGEVESHIRAWQDSRIRSLSGS